MACVCIAHSIDVYAKDWRLSHYIHRLANTAFDKVNGQLGFTSCLSLPSAPGLLELILIELILLCDEFLEKLLKLSILHLALPELEEVLNGASYACVIFDDLRSKKALHEVEEFVGPAIVVKRSSLLVW